jgi:glycosyltransferase involved in cell wall biosynthesis
MGTGTPQRSRAVRLLYVDNAIRTFVSHRLWLAREALRQGFAVHVAVPDGDSAPDLVSALEGEGIVIHGYHLRRRGLNPFSEVRSVASLLNLYAAVRPDLVHNVRIKPVIYGGWAARVAGVRRVVGTITGLGYAFHGESLLHKVLQRVIGAGLRYTAGRSGQRTIFQNQDDRERILSKHVLDAKTCCVVEGSGVDVHEFSPQPPPAEVPLVVLPSRMLWDKGVEEFVAAAAALRAESVPGRFALVGDSDGGNPLSIPAAQLKEWAGEGAVEWWGWRSDMPAILRRAHIVCLPSYGEGCPKVLLESAAAGRPVVTTDVAGCRSIVEDGVNGFLVRARNVADLVAALRTLLLDESLRVRMGENNRKLALARFSNEIVSQQMFSLYYALLDEAPPEGKPVDRGSLTAK